MPFVPAAGQLSLQEMAVQTCFVSPQPFNPLAERTLYAMLGPETESTCKESTV